MNNEIKKFTRAALYMRVSTENQRENYSIAEQTTRLEAYCVSKDWSIYRIYQDPAYSGGNMERPALKEMLKDIRQNRIDVVLVYKLDRLSRSQKDTLTLIEDEFLKNGVEFVSITDSCDTSTPYGRLMIGLLSAFAQLEKDQIKERFTLGREGRSRSGYYHGGATAPTGYKYIIGTDKEKGKLIIDEYKALQVKEIYSRFLSGYSINAIQRDMNDKYGGWSSKTVINMVLRNATYTGKVKFNGAAYDGKHEPIIDEDTFTKVQMLLKSKERTDKYTPSQKTPFKASHLLSSIIYCEKCGAKYCGIHGKYRCYSRAKCDKKYVIDPNCKNKHWDIDKLNDIIIDQIKELRHDRKYIDGLFTDKNEEPNVNIKALKKRTADIDKQISKLIDLYQVEGISINDIKSRLEVLQKEKDLLEDKLSEPIEDAKETKRKFVSMLNNFDNVFDNNLLAEKRLFISSIIKSIIINDENITINWRI